MNKEDNKRRLLSSFEFLERELFRFKAKTLDLKLNSHEFQNDSMHKDVFFIKTKWCSP